MESRYSRDKGARGPILSIKQERLANAKVSAQQQIVYEGP